MSVSTRAAAHRDPAAFYPGLHISTSHIATMHYCKLCSPHRFSMSVSRLSDLI